MVDSTGNGAEDFVTRERKRVRVARMSPSTDELPAVTAKLLEVVITLRNKGEFEVKGVRARAISSNDGTGWVVQVTRASFDKAGVTWELVANIDQDTLFGEPITRAEVHEGHP